MGTYVGVMGDISIPKNLYKIAPRKGGNPSEAWQKMQREACVELLRAEIEFFNPTHILFVTGTMQTAD